MNVWYHQPIYSVQTIDFDLFELDVSILLLLTNRYNKGILLHFCQQNGKKIAKLKILTKPSGNGLKNILGQKKFFGA